MKAESDKRKAAPGEDSKNAAIGPSGFNTDHLNITGPFCSVILFLISKNVVHINQVTGAFLSFCLQ